MQIVCLCENIQLSVYLSLRTRRCNASIRRLFIRIYIVHFWLVSVSRDCLTQDGLNMPPLSLENKIWNIKACGNLRWNVFNVTPCKWNDGWTRSIIQTADGGIRSKFADLWYAVICWTNESTFCLLCTYVCVYAYVRRCRLTFVPAIQPPCDHTEIKVLIMGCWAWLNTQLEGLAFGVKTPRP